MTMTTSDDDIFLVFVLCLCRYVSLLFFYVMIDEFVLFSFNLYIGYKKK